MKGFAPLLTFGLKGLPPLMISVMNGLPPTLTLVLTGWPPAITGLNGSHATVPLSADKVLISSSSAPTSLSYSKLSPLSSEDTCTLSEITEDSDIELLVLFRLPGHLNLGHCLSFQEMVILYGFNLNFHPTLHPTTLSFDEWFEMDDILPVEDISDIGDSHDGTGDARES